MAPRKRPSDSEWLEVKRINGYAAFLGCLLMANRGLSFLVITWSTVVLLGGFVSVLQKKDFWCLTVITFIQIAGVVDGATSNEKMSSVSYSVSGLNAITQVFARNRLAGIRRPGCMVQVVAIVEQTIGIIASVVQILAYQVVFYGSMFCIFISGIYVATGVSLWRLTQRDYGTGDGNPSKANMKPALDILYTLVVIQGGIWIYTIVVSVFAWRKIVEEVAAEYGFRGPAVALVREYMKAIQRGCCKDPSFANGKNLVTYAVDLMGPDKSRLDFSSGFRILSTILGPFSRRRSDTLAGQRVLIQQLVMFASSGYVLRNLLVMSNSTGHKYDTEVERRTSREITERAARIVAHVANEASLEQLPQVIQCISSLIDTFGEYHQRAFCNHHRHGESRKEEEEYMEMLLEGLHILFVLAADENKCGVISGAPGLLPKIMAPLTSDLLHQASHVAWRDVAAESLRVMLRLTAAPGKTGAKLRHEISINGEAISTMTRILSCDECNEELQLLAMGILTKLDMGTTGGGREDSIKMLVGIFTDDNRGISIRRSAIEALAKLCFQDGSNATIILQVNGDIVDHLIAKLEDFNGYLSGAAVILEQLCIHYTRDGECLKKLKETMTDVMPKVLSQILSGEATQIAREILFSPYGNIQYQRPDRNRRSSPRQESEEQHDDRETTAALLSLCVTVCDTFISGDQDLALKFDAVDALSSLPVKLREMVIRNSDPTVSCLKIVKLTTRMLVSMMRHRGSYLKKDLESLVGELDNACYRNMFVLDSSMAFVSIDDDGAASTKKPERTLLSLMEEARELAHSYKAEELEVMAQSISANREP